MAPTRFLIPLALLAACSADKADTGKPPAVDTLGGETAEDCVGGTTPTISDLTLENSGMAIYEDDDEYPTLTIWADVADDDQDLQNYAFDVYYDAVVDSSVEASSSKHFGTVGTLSNTDCGAPSGTVGLKIFLAGGGVEYNSLYEWGGTVTDATGLVSDMALTSGYTPTATGEDGCP